MLTRTCVVLLGALFTSLSAFGTTYATQWTIASSGGAYSWAGGSAPLVGSNIVVTQVEGEPTPMNSGTSYTITDGSLNFTSGAYNGTPGSTWSWGSGGSLSLTGCIAGITAPSCNGSNNVVLVSDNFTNVLISTVNGSNKVTFGNLTGTINSTVAAYFGISPVFSVASTASDFVTIPQSPGSPFSGAPSTAPGGTMDLVAAENWSLSSTLGLFVFALAIFGAVDRLGLLKTVLRQQF